MVDQALDQEYVEAELIKLHKDHKFDSLAVVLMHSYACPESELRIGEIAKKIGFSQVSLSHQIMQRIKLVKRGQTCCVDAYLNPHSNNHCFFSFIFSLSIYSGIQAGIRR
jgi:5-oxoprolinase (ATP-hydrolysing)